MVPLIIFLDPWKRAIIVPYQKSGVEDSYPHSSFRPICLLSCQSKNDEQVIVNQLNMFLDSHYVHIPENSGFERVIEYNISFGGSLKVFTTELDPE